MKRNFLKNSLNKKQLSINMLVSLVRSIDNRESEGKCVCEWMIYYIIENWENQRLLIYTSLMFQTYRLLSILCLALSISLLFSLQNMASIFYWIYFQYLYNILTLFSSNLLITVLILKKNKTMNKKNTINTFSFSFFPQPTLKQ